MVEAKGLENKIHKPHNLDPCHFTRHFVHKSNSISTSLSPGFVHFHDHGSPVIALCATSSSLNLHQFIDIKLAILLFREKLQNVKYNPIIQHFEKRTRERRMKFRTNRYFYLIPFQTSVSCD